MRALVLFSSILAVAFARPDVSHLAGYQYNQPSAPATVSRVSVDMVPSRSYEIPAGQSTFEHLGGSTNVASNQYVPPVQTHFSAPATTLLTPTAGSAVSSSAPSVNFITYADQPSPAPTAGVAFHPGFSQDHVSSALPSFPTLSTPVSTGSTQLNAQHLSTGFAQQGVSSTGFDHGLTTGFGQGASTGFNQGASTGFGQGASTGFGQGVTTGFDQRFSNDFTQGDSHITQGVAHNEEIQLSGRFDQGSAHINFPPTRIIQQTKPVVTKHTYVFAAPEDQEEIAPQEPIVLPPPQTHYKIIFIKAPATTIINNQGAALAAQKNTKTIVYVLSNKRVIDRTVEVPELPGQKHPKPEVFFIKYKTPTEKVESKAVYETVDQVDGHGAGLSPRVDDNQVYQPSTVQHEGIHSAGITAVSPQHVQSFVANNPSQGNFQTLHSSSVQEVSRPTSYDTPVYNLGGSGFGSGSASLSQTSGSSGQFLNTGFGGSSNQATNLEYIPPVGGSSCVTC